jgi:hypothetical protein
MSFNFLQIVCVGDLMFSGHTLFYVVFALAWQKYFTVIEKVFLSRTYLCLCLCVE